MIDAFEDHCWQDTVSADVVEIYAHYKRDTFVGPAPALLAIDLYELAYEGGPKPVAELAKVWPSSCGEHAWAAIKPTKRLFATARAAGLPVFYTTMDIASAQQVERRERDAAPQTARRRSRLRDSSGIRAASR